MNIKTHNWNVVIVGHWNTAILTPKGIATRLFCLEDGTAIPVEVPLDGVGPYRVRSEDHGLVVMANNNRLIIDLDNADYSSLKQALIVGKRALEKLPETPVIAAGFNLRFRVVDTNEAMQLFDKEIDNKFSDSDFEIVGRNLTRSLKYGEGTLNIAVAIDDKQECTVNMNFDRNTKNSSDLIKWLQTPVEDIMDTVNKVANGLNLTITEEEDDQDDEN